MIAAVRTLCIPLSFVLASCTLDSDAKTPFSSGSAGGSVPDPSGTSSSSSSEETEPPQPPTDAVAGVCERLDACGFLPPGIRVADCVDTTEACLDDSLQSELADWELVAGSCLQFENCFNFFDCYGGIAGCGVDVEGGAGTSTGPETAGLPDDVTTAGADSTNSTDPGSSSSGVGVSSESTTTGDHSAETTDSTDGPVVCEGSCNPCLDCAFAGPCEVETETCLANPGCLALNDCYLDCENTGGGASCYDLCDAIDPGGVDDLAELIGCAFDVCVEC